MSKIKINHCTIMLDNGSSFKPGDEEMLVKRASSKELAHFIERGFITELEPTIEEDSEEKPEPKTKAKPKAKTPSQKTTSSE